LEAVYFKRPIIVNRYPVYNADIRPLGFEFIELDGFIDDKNVEMTQEVVRDKVYISEVTERNYKIAQDKFSLEVLQKILKDLLENFK
jgi:hypothetical protein